MTAPGHLEVRRFPLPEPAPGAVVMKVTYSGICGTDKHTYRGESKQYAGTDHERDIIYPLICGHENVGVIEAIGGGDSIPDSEGRPLRAGDRVASTITPTTSVRTSRTTATACMQPTLRIFSAAGRSTCTCFPERRSSECPTVCRTRSQP